MTPEPLTAGELLAILAVLLARLGKDHPLTRRAQALHDLCGCGPNPYRPETATTEAIGAPVTLAAPDAINPPPNPSAAVTEPHNTEGA